MTAAQRYTAARLSQIGYTLERALDTPCLAIALRVKRRGEHKRHRVADTVYCSCGRSWDVKDTEGRCK